MHLKNSIIKQLVEIFDLKTGTEFESKIRESIKSGIIFKGGNVWALIFAIFIASIGLNMNSIPVIIGAMLISPLMGPIIGLGYSIVVHDINTLRQSVKNLLTATLVSIIVSTIYFLLTPIEGAQSELLARTSPTIYDVLIAFFGGLVGIIASSRIDKGNVIPGVAIATALMPPLCTIGYGIANWQTEFIFGAAYLFVINAVFICIATITGLKILGFKEEVFVDPKKRNQVSWILSSISILIIIPSMYFAYENIDEINFRKNAVKFIEENFESRGIVLLNKNFDTKSNPRKIELLPLSEKFSNEDIQSLNSSLTNYNLFNSVVSIKQNENIFTKEELANVIGLVNSEQEKIKILEKEILKLNSQEINQSISKQIKDELTIIDPRIANIAIGEMEKSDLTVTGTSSIAQTTVLLFTNQGLSKSDEEKINSLLKVRLQKDKINTYFIKNF